jgi:hypothetical protein
VKTRKLVLYLSARVYVVILYTDRYESCGCSGLVRLGLFSSIISHNCVVWVSAYA